MVVEMFCKKCCRLQNDSNNIDILTLWNVFYCFCLQNETKYCLFHKYEIDGGDEADESCQMVPVQALSLEEDVGDDGENDERYALLYHFELY